MALDWQGLRLTDDHTLESASEVMTQLQFDRRLPNGHESCESLLRDLGFRGNQDRQDGEENTQFAFQGQCLILGDARVGKTSLKKSLIGKSFDVQEPGTKGVQISLVDRKWKELDANAGLTFGSFTRFKKSVLYKGALYGPGGVEFVFSEEVTSTIFTIASFLFTLLCINWFTSVRFLSSLATVSVGFYVFSFATVASEILLYFLPSEHPVPKLLVSPFTFPRFLIGVGTAYILTGLLQGVECSTLAFSLSEIICNDLLAHLFIVAILLNDFSLDVFILTTKYLRMHMWSEGVETSIPGQLKFKNSVPIMPRFFLFIIPVITGISFGCVTQLSISTSNFQYCHALHLTMLPIDCIAIFRLAQTLCSWVNWQGLISLILIGYIIVEKGVVSLSSFLPLTMYLGMFVAGACHTLYQDWKDINLPFNYARETNASFTFIFIEKIVLNIQKLKRALHSWFSHLKLKFLDFSGDKEYYAYHHIFMRDQAMYIVVFNMANFVDDNFRNIGAKTQRLCFWLESICSKAAPKTPIFLVGTQRGQMDKPYLENIDKHLRQSLLHAFNDELVMNKEDKLLYFPTENTLGQKDRGIQNLQREIMSKAEEQRPTMGREIPYSWIKIQDAIINLRQNKKAKFCVTLKQFPVSVGDFICSNWSKETLKYFHEKGLVIYVDQGQDSELSDWILLKPDILVDIIIQLVTPLTDEEVISQHGFRRDWKLLHNTGMLTESLLENILSTWQENCKALQSFLEQYDIICPLFYQLINSREEAQVTHFVPSLLPMSADVNTPIWLDCHDDKKFYVFFHRFLPEALFQHLLSRAHKNSKVEFPRGQPIICKDAGRFWLRPSQPYRLSQLKNEEMIEVTFHYRGQGMKPSDVLCQVFSMVHGICKRHFPYVKFHCGPVCPSDHCPGYQGDYISHPGVQQSCSHRRHVFNVLPARQEDVHASFYCVNQNFEEYLKDWVV